MSNSRSNPTQAPVQASTQSKAVSSGTANKAPAQTKKTSNDNAKKDTKHAKKSSVGTIKQSKKSVSNAAKKVSHDKKLKADPSRKVKVKPGKLIKTSEHSHEDEQPLISVKKKRKKKSKEITVPEVPEQVMPVVSESTKLKPKEFKGDKKNLLKSKRKEEQRLESKRKRESLEEVEIDNRASQMKRLKALPPEQSSSSENELRDTDTSEDEVVQPPKKPNQRTIQEDKSTDSESELESEVESTSSPKGSKSVVAPPITMILDETVNAPFFVSLNSTSPLYDIHAVMTKNKVLSPPFLFPYLLPNA